MNILLLIIEYVSLFIWLIWVLIISIGAFKWFYEYLFNKHKHFREIRLTLWSHLILWLDFMVWKDIIDTLLLDKWIWFWEDLALLIVVVWVRIILTVMTQKEIDHIAKHKK